MNTLKNVAYTYNGILLILKKDGNPAICNSRDGSEGHDAKWNKPDRKTDTAWFHLYVESKRVKHIEAEGKMVIAREEGREWGNGEMLVKRYKVFTLQNNFWRSTVQNRAYD